MAEQPDNAAPYGGATVPVLKTSGAELYYETHGSGPAIVFAHGAGGNHLSWHQEVPFFRDRFTCITFDSRGFGRS